MNVTNSDFEIIKRAIELLPHGNELEKLDDETQNVILMADNVLLKLNQKRNRDNTRAAKYIAERRKVDKDYARSRKKEGYHNAVDDNR